MKKLSLLLLLTGCSTTGMLSDTAMPDRFGIGTGTGSAAFDGTITTLIPGGGGHNPNDMEYSRWDGEFEDMVTATAWLEWDLPKATTSGRTSFEGLKNAVLDDYRGKPKESLISITKSVDEVTGEETWDFGVTEALNSAILALLSFLGFKVMKKRQADD